MIDPFQYYKVYLAIKTHFRSPQYDFFKANGGIRATKASYLKRNDKYFFYKLTKRYKPEEYKDFLIANLVKKPEIWVGELVDSDSHTVYRKWQGKIESLEYVFEQDIIKLVESGTPFRDFFVVPSNTFPEIMQLVMREDITLETLLIIDMCMPFLHQWEKIISDEIVFPEFHLRCVKYQPFLQPNIEIKKFGGILRKNLL